MALRSVAAWPPPFYLIQASAWCGLRRGLVLASDPLVARRITGIALPALAATALWAAPAHAALATVDLGCYLSRQSVVVTGSGFTPNTVVHVSVAGRQVGDATADANGAVRTNLRAPVIARSGPRRRTFTVSLSDGITTASTRLLVTRAGVDFAPSRGNPRRLRARFSVFGLGPAFASRGQSARQVMYLHYLDPRGRRRGNFRVGFTRGACGDLRTARRRVLPFRPLYGLWRLVFDARRTYSRRGPQLEIGFRVRRRR
jgi:hypothetical protein